MNRQIVSGQKHKTCLKCETGSIEWHNAQSETNLYLFAEGICIECGALHEASANGNGVDKVVTRLIDE